MRWTKLFSAKATRALSRLEADLTEVFATALDAGADVDALEMRLIEDLQSGGPTFGPFLRGLGDAAEAAVDVAHRQGELVGMSIGQGELAGTTTQEAYEILYGKDANKRAVAKWTDEKLEKIARSIEDNTNVTWVALLVNSCPYCIALHGTTLSGSQWRQRDLAPDGVHQRYGINAKCRCRFVPSDIAESRASLVAPLKRVAADGLKKSKKTVRGVTQVDPDKALDAVKKAQESPEGRKVLRLMGRVDAEKPEEK